MGPVAASGRQAIRRTNQYLYQASNQRYAETFEYLTTGTAGRHDDQLSRVSRVKVGTTVVASYEYLGSGRVAMVTMDLTCPQDSYHSQS